MPTLILAASPDLVKSGFYASGWPLVIAAVVLFIVWFPFRSRGESS